MSIFRKAERDVMDAKAAACLCDKCGTPMSKARAVREHIEKGVESFAVRRYICACNNVRVATAPLTAALLELALAVQRFDELPHGLFAQGTDHCPNCNSTSIMVGMFPLSCGTCGWSHLNGNACDVCGAPSVSSAGATGRDGVSRTVHRCGEHRMSFEQVKQFMAGNHEGDIVAPAVGDAPGAGREGVRDAALEAPARGADPDTRGEQVDRRPG